MNKKYKNIYLVPNALSSDIGFNLLQFPNYPKIPMPIDTRAITLSISTAVFTLDVVLMVVGVFLMGIAWLFNRLAQ